MGGHKGECLVTLDTFHGCCRNVGNTNQIAEFLTIAFTFCIGHMIINFQQERVPWRSKANGTINCRDTVILFLPCDLCHDIMFLNSSARATDTACLQWSSILSLQMSCLQDYLWPWATWSLEPVYWVWKQHRVGQEHCLPFIVIQKTHGRQWLTFWKEVFRIFLDVVRSPV